MSRVSCRSSAEKAMATFAPRDAMGLPPKKVLRASSEVLDFVRDDFRRLRRQGEESEEIASSCRVRSESAFEASKGVFVLEQGDHHALRRRNVDLGRATRRGNPAPSGSRWHGLGGFGVPRPPCLPGNGTGRIEGTWRGERTDSHRTSGHRQLYLRPESSCAPCSAGRISEETRRSARSAAPTRSSSSNTPTETIRSSITSARSVTSAGTKAFRTGMSPRPGGTRRKTNETRG